MEGSIDFVTILRDFGFPVVAFFVIVWIYVTELRHFRDEFAESVTNLSKTMAAMNHTLDRLIESESAIRQENAKLVQMTNMLLAQQQELVNEMVRFLARINGHNRK